MLNYPIKSNEILSQKLRTLGINSMDEVLTYVQQMLYARISDKNNLELLLSEQRGTCSTKHAFVKKVAEENEDQDLQLIIGIYKMNRANTPGIKDELEKHNLAYMPEAHCYLKWNNKAIDITTPQSNFDKIAPALLEEHSIKSHQTGQYKVDLHQNYLLRWLPQQKLPFSFEQIWEIRENCIRRLSGN